MNTITINGKTYTKSHTSAHRGYVSRKTGATEPMRYSGKFGEGYVVFSPRRDTTRYCYITYYI